MDFDSKVFHFSVIFFFFSLLTPLLQVGIKNLKAIDENHEKFKKLIRESDFLDGEVQSILKSFDKMIANWIQRLPASPFLGLKGTHLSKEVLLND